MCVGDRVMVTYMYNKPENKHRFERPLILKELAYNKALTKN